MGKTYVIKTFQGKSIPVTLVEVSKFKILEGTYVTGTSSSLPWCTPSLEKIYAILTGKRIFEATGEYYSLNESSQ